MFRRILGVLAVSTALLTPAVSAHADSGTGLPSDPQASGYIGLCDDTGHSITEGSTTTTPFAWKAISTFRPPAQFQGPGQNAVLQIYQPRPNVAPAYWSGFQLTSTGFYASKDHPTAQATYQDTSLAQYMKDYPPLVNGLYVLRMAYGKLNYGVYTTRYPTTTIQVVGSQWRVVSGGTVDCGAGTAKSNEQLTGVVSKHDITPRKLGQTGPGASSTPSGTTHGSAAPASAPAGSSAAGAVTRAPVAVARSGDTTVAVRHAGGSDSALWWVLAVAALLLIALALFLRHRRSTPPSSTA